MLSPTLRFARRLLTSSTRRNGESSALCCTRRWGSTWSGSKITRGELDFLAIVGFIPRVLRCPWRVPDAVKAPLPLLDECVLFSFHLERRHSPPVHPFLDSTKYIRFNSTTLHPTASPISLALSPSTTVISIYIPILDCGAPFYFFQEG